MVVIMSMNIALQLNLALMPIGVIFPVRYFLKQWIVLMTVAPAKAWWHLRKVGLTLAQMYMDGKLQ